MKKDKLLKILDRTIRSIEKREKFLASCPEGLKLDALETLKSEGAYDILDSMFETLDKFLDSRVYDKGEWADLMIKANKYKDDIERLKGERG